MPIEEHVSEKEKYCANWTDTIYTRNSIVWHRQNRILSGVKVDQNMFFSIGMFFHRYF